MNTWEDNADLVDPDAICPRCGGEAYWEEERDEVNCETAERLQCIGCGAVLDIIYTYG